MYFRKNQYLCSQKLPIRDCPHSVVFDKDMARQVRKVSRSGIYHVMLRGVNKQRIFEKPSDFEAMQRIIRYVQTKDTQKNPLEKPSFFLYAYCIMDNHVHLLIQPNGHELGQIMKRIMTTYAIYFNNEYERVGHLFQNRYKSEVVEDVKYFFTLLNYIHHNPVEAGYCAHPGQYAHSSYNELTGKLASGDSSLCIFQEDNLLGVSSEQIREFVGQEGDAPKESLLIGKLKELTRESSSELCQYIRTKLDWISVQEKDAAVVKLLLEMTGTKNISEFQQLDKKTMRSALAVVRDSGVPQARIARLTGIPVGVIRYAKVKFNEAEP